MAQIRRFTVGEEPQKGHPATHVIEDGRGNIARGHFEAIMVPSFEPGTRIADLAFIIDDVIATDKPPQSNEALLERMR